MKDIMLVIACQLCALVLVVGAVVLAYHGKQGWGLFLIVALFMGSISVTRK